MVERDDVPNLHRIDGFQFGIQGRGRTSLWTCQKPLELCSGETLPAFELAYTTYGVLNKDRSNAVLICPALNASSVVVGEDATGVGCDGWWNTMVGPGRPINTDAFYVICVANLGSCFGSTESRSVDPATGQSYGSDFPFITIQDWATSQEMLLREHLGIHRLAAVVGGSMGGMQALQWAVTYPDKVDHAVIIASTARLNAQNIAFNQVARQAILADPKFLGGNYVRTEDRPYDGLRIARMLSHITYTSKRGLERKFGRTQCHETFRYGPAVNFEVESYLNYQAEKFASHFDANSYLRITRALDHFDIARDQGGGSLQRAMGRVKAKVLLISFCDDWRFGPDHSGELADALRLAQKSVALHEIEGSDGHDGFLLSDERYHTIIRNFFIQVRCLVETLPHAMQEEALRLDMLRA